MFLAHVVHDLSAKCKTTQLEEPLVIVQLSHIEFTKVFPILSIKYDEFRRKTSYAPKQKNPVFVGFCKQCTSPMLCKNSFPQNEL